MPCATTIAVLVTAALLLIVSAVLITIPRRQNFTASGVPSCGACTLKPKLESSLLRLIPTEKDVHDAVQIGIAAAREQWQKLVSV